MERLDKRLANTGTWSRKEARELIRAGRVDRMVTTHMGTNPEASQRMLSREMQVELAPMGSFIERIRCGGAGLGGVLTKTGLGTVVEEGK